LGVPRFLRDSWKTARKVDVRLPGKGNSSSHGARPIHLIITMIKWIQTSRLSTQNSLSLGIPRFLRDELKTAVEPFHEQLLHINVKRFGGGLVFKAHRWLYPSTLGSRVIKKKKFGHTEVLEG